VSFQAAAISEQKKKNIAGYRNEGVQIYEHVFGKSVRYKTFSLEEKEFQSVVEKHLRIPGMQIATRYDTWVILPDKKEDKSINT